MGLLDNLLKSKPEAGATPSETVTRLGEVAQRFAEGGCESISNVKDKKALETFEQLPSTVKVKVPGAGQLNTAVQQCKA